jgi:transcriptional regulator with XRE-family HTH domain
MLAVAHRPKGVGMDRPTFGSRVKKFREDKCLSRSELAAALGVSVRIVESWEQGRRSPGAFDVMTKLADALDVTVDDLIRDTPGQERPTAAPRGRPPKAGKGKPPKHPERKGKA